VDANGATVSLVAFDPLEFYALNFTIVAATVEPNRCKLRPHLGGVGFNALDKVAKFHSLILA
jgi:hypothetical protein